MKGRSFARLQPQRDVGLLPGLGKAPLVGQHEAEFAMQPGIIGNGIEQAAENRFANGRRFVVQPLGPQLGQGLVVGESRHGLFQVGQAGGPALLLRQQCRHGGMHVDRKRLRAEQFLPQIQGPAPCASISASCAAVRSHWPRGALVSTSARRLAARARWGPPKEA